MFNFKGLLNKLLPLIIMTLLSFSCQSPSGSSNIEDHTNKILQERTKKNSEIIDSTLSRFNNEERLAFAAKGLQYYEPDISYLVETEFTVDTSSPTFHMATTTDRKPNYRIYGFIDFKVNDTSCRLTVFQNVDVKNHPEHGKYLFIPFKDNTNEITTYGGGRYIDILIPTSSKLKLDFNNAYNPYCAYAYRWSCPLVPFANFMDVSVFAGEKNYK